ncbi:MAG: UDP-N-acetylmuramoyl-L-alanine--D-glutamate ligase [Acidobacteria bacterium]|nr:UDP-N-acetylmuramoyl-L-alanine--D-glutamate ligase [Acidobacteriota bacterium]
MSNRPPYRVLIVGLGASGQAAARLAAAEGAAVRVTDQRPANELAGIVNGLERLEGAFLGGHPIACLDGVDVVVTSPGVAPTTAILAEARSRGIELLPEVEFAWRHRTDAPLAAVTGSNGKSTVTTLIAAMLAASGLAAVAGGNLGTPASELVLRGGWTHWVLEVSSFQTELMVGFRPTVGVFLNLSQDHLERHASFDEYLRAKLQLFAHQTREDAAVLNRDDPTLEAVEPEARRLWFSLSAMADGWLDGDTLRLGGEGLITAGAVALAGRHNLANALAASLAARELGAGMEGMAAALSTFRGLPHRHATVRESDGVRWVDDSKATNVGAAQAALAGYNAKSVHLILGGLGKGQDFRPLAPEVERAARVVYLIGADADKIAADLAGTAPLEMCGTLAEAVTRARRAARAGETVLLAPACASFDQFASYAARGDAFAELVRGKEAGCR